MWKQAVDDLAASGADVTWEPEATCWMIHLQSICLAINDSNIDFSTQRQQNEMFNQAWVSHSTQVIKRVFVYQWNHPKNHHHLDNHRRRHENDRKNPHVVNRVTQLTSSHVWPTFTRVTLKAIVAAAIAPSMCRHNCNNITFLQPLCHWHRQAWTLWAQRLLWHIEEVTPPQNRATVSPSMFRWDIWWDAMILIFIHINMFVSYNKDLIYD